MKPLWALAGVALLGTAGAAGVVLVVSSGGEEEVVQQIETATPTRGAAKDPSNTPTNTPSGTETPAATPAACDPNTTPAPGKTLFRWGDITVQLPADGTIVASGDLANDLRGPVLRLSLAGGDTYIDATTGAIFLQHGERVPEVDAVLATISVCPFDESTAPWPYTGDPPASTPQSLGRARYLIPDPASGVQVLIGGECDDHGCRDAVAVRSARSQMQIDAETGETFQVRVAEEDSEAFERYRASVQFQEAE